jgi:ABC-2 type transport system permease protein
MAAAFGLLVSTLGRTAATTRRMAAFAVLIMVMLGGAWVPSSIFPEWLRRLTVVTPARWAVDGLDAMTWRALGLESAVLPTAVLLLFAVLFGGLAVQRFRWDES